MKTIAAAWSIKLFVTLILMLSLVRPARSFVAHSVSSRRATVPFIATIRGGGGGGGPSSSPYSTTTSTAMAAKPFAVVVQAEIQPDRMDEFLEMIAYNAENSRKEPGCIRFGTY